MQLFELTLTLWFYSGAAFLAVFLEELKIQDSSQAFLPVAAGGQILVAVLLGCCLSRG